MDLNLLMSNNCLAAFSAKLKRTLKTAQITVKKRLFLLGYKDVNLQDVIKCEISVSSSEIRCFPLSSNSIYVVNTQSKILFFRECSIHRSFKEYIDDKITEFYGIVTNGLAVENFKETIPFKTKYEKHEIDAFQTVIDSCVARKGFYKRIKNINYYKQINRFAVFSNRYQMPPNSLFGMGLEPVPDELIGLMAIFIKFISNAVSSFTFHDFLKPGKLETFSGARNVATYELAKLLGVEDTVTSACFVKLIIDNNRTKYGVLSDKALGERALDCDVIITPEMQRAFGRLRLLDSLCMQPDHWVNNYNIVINDQGRGINICAFDNDNNYTFIPYPKPEFYSQCNGAPIVKNDRLNYPFIDKDIVERLYDLNYNTLFSSMKPYLNRLQLWGLWARVKRLKKIISKSTENGSLKLLAADEWSEETILEELSGKYGNTPMFQYYNKENDIKLNKKGRINKVIKFN